MAPAHSARLGPESVLVLVLVMGRVRALVQERAMVPVLEPNRH